MLKFHVEVGHLRVPQCVLPNTCRQHKGAPNLAVLRVAQLDAGRLDSELADMLRESLSKAFAFFRPVSLRQSHAAMDVLAM